MEAFEMERGESEQVAASMNGYAAIHPKPGLFGDVAA
jgi:hypothetical protein